MSCINCYNNHQENYCPNCGQRNGVKKITLPSIAEETFSSLTDMDKGFLYNLKTLTLRPKKIAVDYILGKRKGIFNPISYLILSITLYILVITILKTPKVPTQVTEVAKSTLEQLGNDLGLFLRTHLKFVWIFTIVPLSISFKIVYNKFNFLENLTISSFIIGHATLLGIISYLILRAPLIFDPFVYLIILLLTIKIFKNSTSTIENLLLGLSTLAIFIIQLIILVSCIGLVSFLAK
nr:DUF3667 domain-containing protein [uncultured Psychroserpens sp.]